MMIKNGRNVLFQNYTSKSLILYSSPTNFRIMSLQLTQTTRFGNDISQLRLFQTSNFVSASEDTPEKPKKVKKVKKGRKIVDKAAKKEAKKEAKREKLEIRQKQLDLLHERQGVFPEENDPNLLWHSQVKSAVRKAVATGPPPLNEAQLIKRHELKEILSNKNTSKPLLIDLRETIECQYEAPIPFARNIPYANLEKDLSLTDSRWKIKYGFEKPKGVDEIIIYISPEKYLNGVQAISTFEEQGYTKVRMLVNGHREWNKYYNIDNNMSTPNL